MATDNRKKGKFSGRSGEILEAAIGGIANQEDERGSLDDYLDSDFLKDIRAGVGDLLFAYFRHRRAVERAIVRNTRKAPQASLRQILAAAITQMKYQTGIAPESAVNIAVDYAKRHHGRGSGNFINAVLHSVLRKIDEIKDFPGKIFPDEYYRMLKRNNLQSECFRLEELFLGRSALTFRACKELTGEQLEEIGAEEIKDLDFLPSTWKFFKVNNSEKLFASDLLSSGAIYIQDPATAMAPAMANLSGSEKVLDLCAAPGGKSLLLYSQLNSEGKLLALDISERRLDLVRDNFKRHNVSNGEIICADGRDLPFADKSFDLILMDVPCSNLGVFRKRPDVPVNYNLDKQKELIEIQRAILNSVASKINSNGVLIYSSCTIDKLENEDNLAWFLEQHPEFELIEKQLLLPTSTHDGAFAAKLRRK